MSDPASPAQIHNGVIPYINIEGAAEASVFYQRAFGAREIIRMPAEDGKRILHCHLEINGGSLMMSDCFPEMGHAHQPSGNFTLQLVVDDGDAWFSRAVEAGAEVLMPMAVMFWGDRYGQLRDPFGVRWALNEPAK